MAGLGNQSENLHTYILDASAGIAAQKGDAGFFVHGVDLYASRNTTLDLVGLEGPDTNLEVFRTTLTFTPNGTFQHFDLTNVVVTDLIASLSGPIVKTTIGNAVIGALEFSVLHTTGTPDITFGFDNINVCRDDKNACTFNDQLLFTAPPGGGTYNTPEPASLLLLGAGLAGIGIWRRKAAR